MKIKRIFKYWKITLPIGLLIMALLAGLISASVIAKQREKYVKGYSEGQAVTWVQQFFYFVSMESTKEKYPSIMENQEGTPISFNFYLVGESKKITNTKFYLWVDCTENLQIDRDGYVAGYIDKGKFSLDNQYEAGNIGPGEIFLFFGGIFGYKSDFEKFLHSSDNNFLNTNYLPVARYPHTTNILN